MNAPAPQDLARFAVRLGDDALIWGQRLCEWSSRAPTLEEDIALSNTALDYLGRARMLYTLGGGWLGRDEDHFAFRRDTREFENLLMVELPRGDFALTMVRQFLLDEFELTYFQSLSQSAEPGLAEIAVKTLKEVRYHHRRSTEWMHRLGLGTAESQRRTRQALDELWGYVDELFEMDPLEAGLAARGYAVDRVALRDSWQTRVQAVLSASELSMPEIDWQVSGGRRGVHTEHLGHLLSDLQFMQRAYPGLEW